MFTVLNSQSIKSISNAPPRIQGMLLRLQRYDFDLNFVPGKSISVPDALSKVFLNATYTNEQKFEYQVDMVLDNLLVSKEKLDGIKQATRNDYVLQNLSSTIVEGWPEFKETLPPELDAYFQYRHEITSAEGLLFKGDRVIIPTALCKVMKEKLHHGHIGIQRTRPRARQVMFWPDLNAEITDMISKCSACIENQAYQQKKPLIFHEIPTEPWFKVGMDLLSFRNKSYLVIVDYYSNYIEVCHLYHQRKSPDVISHVEAIFARFGIPRVVISDHGPQFSSTDFKDFAESWDFEHKTSSPDYPKANGMAESAVKAVKRIFKKAYKMNEDPYLALLALRSAPSTNDILSPAQKLFQRVLTTRLPHFRSLVSHKDPPVQLPAKFDQKLRRKQKEYHDRSAKELPQIPNDATVRIHHKSSWPTKAKVLRKDESPRSFHVQTEDGMTLGRNH